MSPATTILLQGPVLDPHGAYGGGMGGAVRSVSLLSAPFPTDEFRVVTVPTTVRRPGEGRAVLPLRLAKDVGALVAARRGAAGLHLIGQYRRAIWRELALTRVARASGLPYLYHIKAGVFPEFVRAASPAARRAAHAVVTGARVVLCEGEPVVDFVRDTYGVDASWFPNFVAASEIPEVVPPLFVGNVLRVLFVGYCYEAKGVLDLLRVAGSWTRTDRRLELTFVGEPTPAFQELVDQVVARGAVVHALGRRPHAEVLARMAATDVFAMPSRHVGEGHTNTVNEAMALGRVVVATRHGYLPSVLGSAGVFLDSADEVGLRGALAWVADHPDEARVRGALGRERLLAQFQSEVAVPRLTAAWRHLVGAAS